MNGKRNSERTKDGNYNFECLEAIDAELFNQDMLDLLSGKEVALLHLILKQEKENIPARLKSLGNRMCL